MDRPPKSIAFTLHANKVVPGAVVVDGASQSGRTKHGEHWVPRTLYLSVGGNLQMPADWATETVQQTLQQWVTFTLTGLHYGAPYRRQFSLWTGAQVRIPLTFDGVRLEVEGISNAAVGNLTNGEINAVFTDEATTGTATEPWLWLATETTGLGAKRVPPGARRMVPQQTDPGFVWNLAGPQSKLANIPQGQAAGVLVDVVGTTYTPGVTPFFAAWQIEV